MSKTTQDGADVVERLDARRNEIERFCERSGESDLTRRAPEHVALYRDAADELTRLRAENEALREAVVVNDREPIQCS